nr:reverse transcriptase domain-containing protein [Tanacetum cinerariifolium]
MDSGWDGPELLSLIPRNLQIVSSGVKSSSRWLPVWESTMRRPTPFAVRSSTKLWQRSDLVKSKPTSSLFTKAFPSSPAFVEANYEVLESLLRERRRQRHNEDIRTELEYFNYTGCVTPFVRSIEDYPFPDELKMPSYVGSYDGKGYPITICTSSKILGLQEQHIFGFVHGLNTRSLVEYLFTDLLTTYKGLMEKTYTWIEVKEVCTNEASNGHRERSERFKKNSSWDNNKGKKNRDANYRYWEAAANHIQKEITRTSKIFAWTHTNITRTPRTITVGGKPFNAEHKFNEYEHIKPVKQKKHGLGLDRNEAACKEGAEKLLPFFKAHKSCVDNKSIQWTVDAEEALWKMKEFMEMLPTLTAPIKGDVLVMYLAASTESICTVLLADREERQVPIYYRNGSKSCPSLGNDSSSLDRVFECSKTEREGGRVPKVEGLHNEEKWDHPLPDGLKMPFHVGSYKGKGYPDNYLHLFEGAIRMQRWAMPVAYHMFTDTLKTLLEYGGMVKRQILGLHEEHHIFGFVHGFNIRSLVEFLFTDLLATYKGLMEKIYTWIEAKDVATNEASNGRESVSVFLPFIVVPIGIFLESFRAFSVTIRSFVGGNIFHLNPSGHTKFIPHKGSTWRFLQRRGYRLEPGKDNLKAVIGVVYHDHYLDGKALVKKENVGFDLTKSDLYHSFAEDLTAKGVGLHMVDSHTGNHREDDFTPLETIRRFLGISESISLSDSKRASSASTVHCIILLSTQLLCALKKGSNFSVPFDKNQLSVASFPLRICTSLSVFGGSKFSSYRDGSWGSRHVSVGPCKDLRSSCNFLLNVVSSCFPVTIVCSEYLSLTIILSSTSTQLRMPFATIRGASFSFFYCSPIMSSSYIENTMPIPLGVWIFMALCIVGTTIPIFYMTVLPSSRSCRELDLTMTKSRTFDLVKGLSSIVISKWTSLRGQECSHEKPTILSIGWCHAYGLCEIGREPVSVFLPFIVVPRGIFLESFRAFSVTIRSFVGGNLFRLNPSALPISAYEWHLRRGAISYRGILFHHRSPHEKVSLVRLEKDSPQSSRQMGSRSQYSLLKGVNVSRYRSIGWLQTIRPSTFGTLPHSFSIFEHSKTLCRELESFPRLGQTGLIIAGPTDGATDYANMGTRLRWESKSLGNGCWIAKPWITCDNKNKNITLSEMMRVSLRITSGVRKHREEVGSGIIQRGRATGEGRPDGRDMTCVPRRIIKHTINANPSATPVSQKQRILSQDKSQVVRKEVAEWLKAGIVRSVSQNLEAYVEDIVVKSQTERGMIADIAKIFDNLRRINKKLNPKKCSFGVKEGKFLGYMVTSEGIKANPAKT